MLEILENSVDFSKLGNHIKEELKATTVKAVISRETRMLDLGLELNFVLPLECIDKFKRNLIGRLRGIEDVNLHIIYKDLVQSIEEAMPFYIDHMISIVNGRFAHVTKTIYSEQFELTEDKITIYALGELSVEILNKEVASEFKSLLLRDLNLDIDVSFENKVDAYEEIGRSIEEKERIATGKQHLEWEKRDETESTSE